MYCFRCGARNADIATVCAHCGQALEDDAERPADASPYLQSIDLSNGTITITCGKTADQHLPASCRSDYSPADESFEL